MRLQYVYADGCLIPYDDYIEHFGVKGQKWAIRRYQNEDGTLTEAGKERMAKIRQFQAKRINVMYDRANKWTDRKIGKLEKKGKTAKAEVWKEMRNQNEAARAQKLANLDKMNLRDYKLSRRNDFMDSFFGGQMFMKNNKANMLTYPSRVSEYSMQRAMRWESNFTRNSTLARMTPSEGVEYLRAKAVYGSGYNAGYSRGLNMR